jgi:uncharacterized protein YigE (DUF2233 family)
VLCFQLLSVWTIESITIIPIGLSSFNSLDMIRIFDLHTARSRRKKRWQVLSKVRDWMLFLIAVCGMGLLGGLLYNQYRLDREVDKLKQTVEDLRQELRPNNSRKNGIRNVTGVGLSKKITDNKGNVFDVFLVDLNKTPVKIYYQDDDGRHFSNFIRLKEYLEEKGETLVFATNGGMYTAQNTPVGLLIVDSKEVSPIDLKDGNPDTNFYLKPNGVFALTDKGAVVMESSKFQAWAEKSNVTFATQSGPMLVIDGNIHPKFRQNSSNLNIRSGVGIISSNQVIFAISEKEVNFYDFAILFSQQFKCKNALFLDGVVSRMYLPALERYDLEGDFGSIIAVSK